MSNHFSNKRKIEIADFSKIYIFLEKAEVIYRRDFSNVGKKNI